MLYDFHMLMLPRRFHEALTAFAAAADATPPLLRFSLALFSRYAQASMLIRHACRACARIQALRLILMPLMITLHAAMLPCYAACDILLMPLRCRARRCCYC